MRKKWRRIRRAERNVKASISGCNAREAHIRSVFSSASISEGLGFSFSSWGGVPLRGDEGDFVMLGGAMGPEDFCGRVLVSFGIDCGGVEWARERVAAGFVSFFTVSSLNVWNKVHRQKRPTASRLPDSFQNKRSCTRKGKSSTPKSKKAKDKARITRAK